MCVRIDAVLTAHRSCTTKQPAIDAGQKAAKADQPSQLVVHLANGQIEFEWTYGNDPYPPSGWSERRPCRDGATPAPDLGEEVTGMAGKSKSTPSSGHRGRSAVTGRFVKQSTVKGNPKTTVNESTKKKRK